MNLLQMINNEGVDDSDGAMDDFASVFKKWYRRIVKFFFRRAKGAKLDMTFKILQHRGWPAYDSIAPAARLVCLTVSLFVCVCHTCVAGWLAD